MSQKSVLGFLPELKSNSIAGSNKPDTDWTKLHAYFHLAHQKHWPFKTTLRFSSIIKSIKKQEHFLLFLSRFSIKDTRDSQGNKGREGDHLVSIFTTFTHSQIFAQTFTDIYLQFFCVTLLSCIFNHVVIIRLLLDKTLPLRDLLFINYWVIISVCLMIFE